MATSVTTLPEGVRSIEREFFWICEYCGFIVNIASTRNRIFGYCNNCHEDNRPFQRYQRITTEVKCDGI